MGNLASKFKAILTATLLAGFLTASTANGLVPELLASRTDSVCDITGTVTEMKYIERSPWTDGTPSTLSIFETHLKVSVHNRRPHHTAATSASPCHAALEKNEMRTYKLCSSAKPKQGDRITGTEGGSPGNTRIVRCIFDLKIVPKPDQQEN